MIALTEPSGGSKRARVFFALWPDADVARRLFELGESLCASSDGRQMRRDTLHLTLAFIGDIPRSRVAELITIGDHTRAATLTLYLDHIGRWRHNRIVWAGTNTVPDALADFVARLGSGLAEAGFAMEQRNFAPHVTLLRNARSDLTCIDINPPITWQIAGFALVESDRRQDGAHYKILKAWTE